MTENVNAIPEVGLDRLLVPQLFKALCDPNRITILSDLAKRCKPLTVSQIAEGLPVDLSVVSRHLTILRDADILIARKQGKEVSYSLNTRNLIATLRAIADAFEACCPEECLADGGKDRGASSSLATPGKRRS